MWVDHHLTPGNFQAIHCLHVIAYNLLYICNLLPEVDPWTSGNRLLERSKDLLKIILYHLHPYYYAVIIIWAHVKMATCEWTAVRWCEWTHQFVWRENHAFTIIINSNELILYPLSGLHLFPFLGAVTMQYNRANSKHQTFIHHFCLETRSWYKYCSKGVAC